MAPPPPKRQRRSTIVLSDDSDSTTEARLPLRTSRIPSGQTQKPLHAQNATTRLRPPSNSKKQIKSNKLTKHPSPKSSPKKPQGSSNAKKLPEKSRSLHTFFGKISEEQRWRRKSATPEGLRDNGDVEDIDDDEEPGGVVTLAEADRLKCEDGSGRKILQHVEGPVDLALQQPPPTSTQRFVKPAVPAKRTLSSMQSSIPGKASMDDRPWSERFAPANLEELAVHKKKVLDVQKWLVDVLNGRDPSRLLILKGPAGSGKSTTMSTLAHSLRLSLTSWSNPTASEQGVTPTVSVQFSDFLSRGGLYDSLSFDDRNSSAETAATVVRSLMLVEEYPTTMSRSSISLEAFRAVVLQYIASVDTLESQIFRGGKTTSSQRPPLVMIVTETLLTSTTAATDSFTAHKLLGAQILNHPLVTVIEFNSVAPTLMTKALDLVIKKEARESQRRRVPGPGVLQKLAEMNDLRSAINTLEFLCARGLDHRDWSGTVASKSKRTGKERVPLTDMEKSSLELVSRRESTLDMFHAAGKVVYNKREDMRPSEHKAVTLPKAPTHLDHLDRPKASEVNIETLLNETGTDIQTFVSTLHENYALSCSGDTFTVAFEGCSHYLSDSDMLNPDSRLIARSRQGGKATVQSSFETTNTDALRQDEIGFHVASRGLLFSLPHPVTRGAHPGGRKGDSYKMFYPASLRLWKPTEEIENLITMHETLSSTFALSNSASPGAEGVAAWRTRAVGPFQTHEPDLHTTSETAPRVYLSRPELILEALPYLAKIKSSRNEDVKTLNTITEIRGLRISENDEAPSDDELNAATPTMIFDGQTPATKPAFQKANTRVADALSRFTQSQTHPSSQLVSRKETALTSKPDDPAVQHLYISDDDIEDD